MQNAGSSDLCVFVWREGTLRSGECIIYLGRGAGNFVLIISDGKIMFSYGEFPPVCISREVEAPLLGPAKP